MVYPQAGAPTDEIVLPGNTQPLIDAPIYARTNGYLKKWYSDIGTRVKAGDLIAEAVLAIEMGADAADIGLTIHPHPTLSETVALAAEAFEGTITDLYLPRRS